MEVFKKSIPKKILELENIVTFSMWNDLTYSGIVMGYGAIEFSHHCCKL